MDEIAKLRSKIMGLEPEKRRLFVTLLKQQGVDVSQLPISPRDPHETNLRLSFAQERMWFLNQLEPGSAHYNVPLALRVKGVLNITALQRALDEIMRRHETLRTQFKVLDGDQPVQVIQAPTSVTMPRVDLTGLDEPAREAELRRLCVAEARSPFDLARDPMIRAKLLCLQTEEHIFLLVTHHIASDGWSMGLFINELKTLYQAFCEGRPSPLLELPIQYADFALWQRDWLAGAVFEEQLAYWKQQLEGAPAFLELPTDYPRPAIQSYRGAVLSHALSHELSTALVELSRKENVTLFMLLLAALQALLQRYTGFDDIVVGSPIAGRNRTEVESLIGFFANTVVLRGDLSGNPSFRELLERTRKAALGAYANQDLPIEKLVEALSPARDLSYSPLFQVVLVLQNMASECAELAGLECAPLPLDNGTSKFDLTILVTERAAGLRLEAEYNTDLFAAGTIQRMLGHYQNLLEAIVAQPAMPLRELPLLSALERRQLLVEWNPKVPPYPKDRCLHQLIEAQAARTPEAVAVVWEDQWLTYQQLNERANQLAHYLQKLGVGPDTLVGLFVERSLDLVVGLLGILKSGGAYLPMDPQYPQERLRFMLADSKAAVVVTQNAFVAKFAGTPAKVVCLDQDWPEIARQPATNPESPVQPDHLAYVIYTSGSTGNPKGSLISHYNVVRLFQATQDWFHFTSADVWTLFHSYAFDFSVWEIFGALLYGGRLVVVPYMVSRTPEEFYRLLHDEGVTVLNQTPSAFQQLIGVEEASGTSGRGTALSLRLVIFGGEALNFQSLKPWFDRHGDEHPRLVNMYGITETTVHVTYRPICAADLAGGSVIGKPIPDLRVYVLDAYRQPVPIGVPGEIYVGGAGVGRGYLNQAGLTAQKFVPDPFASGPGAVLYRSGDLGRFLANGDLEYLGRIDHQVKIRGFRIELGEIEALLSQHPDVNGVVVLAREDVPGDQRLVAYLTSKNGEPPPVSELRAALQAKLPEYMLPSAFVILDRLPLTTNGKVDRKALPKPEIKSSSSDHAPPKSAVEIALAKIWGEILGLKEVGPHDNFFDLGGHSLMAIRLASRINRDFNGDLTGRTIFQHPTIAQLAVCLAKPTSANHGPILFSVSEKPKSAQLPLIFIGAGYWAAYLELSLASLLREHHSILFSDVPLAPESILAASADPNLPGFTIKEMAAAHVALIRVKGMAGPCALAGLCFGGLLAFEVAHQLKRAGIEVAAVFLIDARMLPPKRWWRYEVSLRRKIARFMRRNFSPSANAVDSKSSALRQGTPAQPSPMAEFQSNFNVVPWHIAEPIILRNMASYRRLPLEAYGFLFRCSERDRTFDRFDPSLGAKVLFRKGFKVFEVPGDHHGMFLEPGLGTMARGFDECLRQLEQNHPI